MNFNNEKVAIVNKFEKAGYPTRFISSVIKQFEERLEPTNVENELIIPEFFFQEIKRRIIIEIPFCVKNEIATKRFITKLKAFTHDKYEFIIKWITKKVKQLFSTKDKDPHPSCKIYEGICSCSISYVGETKRNVAIRWKEHENPNKDSEPAKHLRTYPDHFFTWKILLSAPHNIKLRKNLEASIIAIKRPILNEQIESKKLILFKHGVT